MKKTIRFPGWFSSLRNVRPRGFAFPAGRLHVVRQTMSKWKKGLSVPDADLLIQLAEELGTTVLELLGEEKEVPAMEVEEIAEKLELLNRRFADMLEKRRQRWRIFFLLLGIVALAWLIPTVHFAIASGQGAASVAIIGGADGPTSILVSSAKPAVWQMGLSGALIVVAAIGLIRNRRK